MKFSIIMPTWNRANILNCTINSVMNQTHSDWELLIMDDGSTDETPEVLKRYVDFERDRGTDRIKVFRHETPLERIISRTELMREATGDWILWMDSDDELVYGALEILKHNIEANPEYKMFNMGQIILSLTGTTLKVANELPEWSGEGHYHFDSGLVGTGGFVFHRDCLKEIPEMPQVTNIYEFADRFGELVEAWFEKNDPGAPHQKYNQADKFVGNPWGDDFFMVWLLTRKFKSKKLPLNLYIAYIRTEPWQYERAFISGTMLC